MNVQAFLEAVAAGEGETMAGAFLDWEGEEPNWDEEEDPNWHYNNGTPEEGYLAEDEAATDDDGDHLSDDEVSMRPQRAKPEPYAPAEDDSIEHAHWKIKAWTEYSRKRPGLMEPVE